MNKKERERNILNLIFEKENIIIRESECPDFIIKNKKEQYLLGVEITELFLDETAARLFANPNYFGDIVEHQNYKHKDDKKTLQIVTLTSIPDTPDEKPIKLKGIMRNEEYTLEKFIERLCFSIKKKDKKYLKYEKSLNAIDLVIYNYDLSFLRNKEDLYFAMLCNEDFRKCLMNTRFREIYFVSRFEKEYEQYIGFKSQHFAHMYFWFLSIASSYYGREFLNVNKISHYSRLVMFSVFLLKSGFKNIYISTKGVPKLYYSDVNMVIDYNNSPFVRVNRFKHITNINKLHVGEKCQFPIDDMFMSFANDYQKNKVPKLNSPLLFNTERRKEL